MSKTNALENSSKESRLEKSLNALGVFAIAGTAFQVGAFANTKGSALETWAKGRNDRDTLLWLIEHGSDLMGPLIALGAIWGIFRLIHLGTDSRHRWISWLCATLTVPGYILFFLSDIGAISALSFFSKTN